MGICDVDYIVFENGWYFVIIKKYKNFFGCIECYGY